MANKILEEYKSQISSLELEPSGGGCFEVKVGDTEVYSKLGTGEFPDEDKLVAALASHL